MTALPTFSKLVLGQSRRVVECTCVHPSRVWSVRLARVLRCAPCVCARLSPVLLLRVRCSGWRFEAKSLWLRVKADSRPEARTNRKRDQRQHQTIGRDRSWMGLSPRPAGVVLVCAISPSVSLTPLFLSRSWCQPASVPTHIEPTRPFERLSPHSPSFASFALAGRSSRL